MAIFKCKMCGGALEISGGETVALCEYCGTKQTLPRLTDDRKANLFDRANHFRRNNEFDKAMSIYESILNEDKTDAESYWSLVLCRYGIEYVEDPASHKRIPTVNRAQYTSIFMDEDFKSALEYADGVQKEIYESEAKAIDEIQKGILEISQKEEPFDVFICYKETDANGRRTPDSVVATELYHELCKEGFKVFFARITLEDKLGSAYEPYIFAALNSAKVMVVLGTRQEHFNAVWVKNEWSRYLALIKNGAGKTLIPAYKDMDPYDLPEEFSHLQAQDMTKLGFMQDLVRGIRKIAGETEQPAVIKETVVTSVDASANTAPLLERAFMFLEDGDWESADEYCEKVLDLEPKNAEAYLGKLMAELKFRKVNKLNQSRNSLAANSNYQKIMRFGDNALVEKLKAIEHTIIENERKRLEAEEARRKEAELSEVYSNALEDISIGSLKSMISAIDLLEGIIDYKDSKEQIEKTREKIYSRGIRALETKQWVQARKHFDYLEDYKDSKAKKEEACAGLVAEEVEKKEKNKKAIIIGVSALAALILLIVIISAVSKSSKYKEALALEASGNYQEAVVAFGELGYYKDAKKKSFALWDKVAVRETVSAGRLHTVGLKADGTVVAVGDNDDGQCDVSDWTDIIAVSAGWNHTVGLKADGTVIAVGDYEGGRRNVSDWTDIVAVSAGDYHTIGLKADGTVVAVGKNDDGRCDVSAWTNIVAVSAGSNYTIGLKADGTVVAVGNNKYGQCNVYDWTDIIAVSAGGSHTIGLKSDGTVVAAGSNSYEQDRFSSWTDIIAISAGWMSHMVGLKADGTVVAVGYNDYGKCDVSDWTDIVAVSAGSNYTIGLKADGTVVAVGYNDDGQCDVVADWTNIKTPD